MKIASYKGMSTISNGEFVFLNLECEFNTGEQINVGLAKEFITGCKEENGNIVEDEVDYLEAMEEIESIYANQYDVTVDMKNGNTIFSYNDEYSDNFVKFLI